MPAAQGAPTALFRFYRCVTRAALPLARRSVTRKLRAAGVPQDRIGERSGHATLPRPDAPLIWVHAVSVGESLSVLTLMARLAERLPQHQFLITSGTATAAELIAKRMPPRARHQFAPLDAPRPVARFLDHWRPDAAIFVDSELWPLTLAETRARGARLALVNARLSTSSVRGWSKFPDTARFVLDQFAILLAQNPGASANLKLMGADPARVRIGGNLKATAAPLPVVQEVLAQLRAALGSRPLWIASSTHPGEEEAVLEAHRQVLARHPDLLLLLIPRHPDRGDEIATLTRRAGLSLARRSAGAWPEQDSQVYLADTLGETGTWYAAAPIVFLGGSLKPIGGHNPFEPAQAGAAVLTGPGYFNFTETYGPLIALGGAREVADAGALAQAVSGWLDAPERLDQARDAARRFVAGQSASLDGIVEMLCAALALEPDDG